MNIKRIAPVVMAGVMVFSLTACGDKGNEVAPEVKPVNMVVYIENDRDVDITGLSVYSDVRVDEKQQQDNPENTGVSSLLGEDKLTPGDVVEIKLTVDDPMANAKQAEDGTVTGEQKFVVAVTDINGNSIEYTGQTLKNDCYLVITDNGIDMYDSYELGSAASDLEDEATEAKNDINEAVDEANQALDNLTENTDETGSVDGSADGENTGNVENVEG